MTSFTHGPAERTVRETVRVTITITDAEVRSIYPHMVSNTQRWQPQQTRVTWTRERLGHPGAGQSPWTSWTARATVHGPRIGKDGKPWPSGAVHVEQWVTARHPEWGPEIEISRPPS